jgi:hypothetical protein
MKVKALRTKTEPKEFIHLDYNQSLNICFLGTSNIPNIQPETATLEGMIEYFGEKEIDVDWNNIELVEFDLIESGEVGADIRNKLGPIKNLVSMVGLISSGTFDIEDKKMIRMIKGDVDKCKKNIKYIADLL